MSFLASAVAVLTVALLVPGQLLLPSPAGAVTAPRAVTTLSRHAGSIPAGSWAWPVAAPHPVLRPFSLEHPYAAGHRGIDIAAAAGDAVTAPAAGTVSFAGIVVDRPVLAILHDDGSVASLEPVVAVVATGDRVEQGQLVARLSEQHRHAPGGGLHLGARIDDAYLDPLQLLGEIPPAVLLPLGDTARA